MPHDFAAAARASRTIDCAHTEAFQLMLYRAEDNAEAWIWNSRDGVTPFCALIDGKEYRHLIHGYRMRFTAILPSGAPYVWASYTPASWEAMVRAQHARMIELPVPDDWEGPTFADHHPTADSLVEVRPFEPGQPELLTRAEFLARSPEWMARYAEEDQL